MARNGAGDEDRTENRICSPYIHILYRPFGTDIAYSDSLLIECMSFRNTYENLRFKS
jgi:hypothetical protein